MYDEDEVSSPDFMGRISVDIHEVCKDKAAKRAWHTLLPEEGKSDNVKGAVELIAQWWYNPALDFEPFMEPDDHADAPPNELRVAIVAARDLAIKDKNLLSRTRRLHLHAIDVASHRLICPQVEGWVFRPALHAHGVGHGAQGPVDDEAEDIRT